MPGLKHQSIVQILRDQPQLLVMFLGRSGFQLPSGAFPVIADSDLSHRGPRILKELRSDNVFLFQGEQALDLSIHEARMFALVSIAEARPERYRRYVHLIRIFTPRHARQELEQLMEDLFKDTFIDRFLEEGRQLGIERGMQQGMEQGKQLGRADSAARVLVTILAARGIAVADQLRTRIAECTDPDVLERWATRAATSTTIDEVFAS
jgi:hypothetical protein